MDRLQLSPVTVSTLSAPPSPVVLQVVVHADGDGPEPGQLERHLPPDPVAGPRHQHHLACGHVARVTQCVMCHVCNTPATSRSGRGVKDL